MKIINNYDIFYSYKLVGDTLIVSIFDGETDKVVTNGVVEVCYTNNEVSKLRFNNISKIIKIHSNGLIPLPNKLFVDILNNILSKERVGLSLGYKEHSNYIIGEVVDINKVNIGNEIINIDTSLLNNSDLVVIAKPHVRLATGKWTLDYHICTYLDLHLDESEQVFVIDEDFIPGTDFFKTEEK